MMLQIFRSFLVLLVVLFISAPTPGLAALKIDTWKTYGNLAEQDAICASFASLMESQSLLNADLGALWTERRKYSGTIIRKASEMETGTAANPAEIDVVISDYREWVLTSLLAPIAPIDLAQQGGNPLTTGRDRIAKLIQTYCLAIFAKGDAVVLKRLPHLAYLTNQPEAQTLTKPAIADTAPTKKAEAAAAKVISSMLSSIRTPNAEPPKSTPKQRPPKPVELTSLSAPKKQGYVAQLASFSSQKRAETSRDLLIQKFPRVFTLKTLQIEEHKVGSGSRFFRVQTDALSKGEARALCDILWPHKISCMVRQSH